MGILDFFKTKVEKLEEKKDVEGLINALKDKNWLVRKDAAVALGEIGDERAVEPLIQALKDESEWVPEKAAFALGKIGDKRAVEPLIRALGHEELHDFEDYFSVER
jgi:HEAT repeat protein